jgi:Zn-dependent protease with chaperone function
MDGLERARELLPWWVEWLGPAVAVLLALVASALGAWVAMAIALFRARAPADAHWAERARITYPARAVGGLCLLSCPLLGVVLARLWIGPLTAISYELLATACFVAGFTVVAALHLRLLRHLLPEPPTVRYWLSGVAVLWLVVRPVLLIAGALALTAPADIFSPWMLLWVLAAVSLLGAAARGLGLRVARWLGLAWPASERLQAVVDSAAERVGLRPRTVFELRWPMVNAAAFPASLVLVFSDAALRKLTDLQLEAVAAHELGHLGEPRRVLALRVLLLTIWIPLAAVRPITLAFGIEGYAIVVVCALLLVLLVRSTLRRMEQRADATATEHQADSGQYARALEAIYRASAIPAVLWGRGTHPHLYDRLTAAGVEPDFERPKPPSRVRLYGSASIGLFLTIALHGAATLSPWLLHEDDQSLEWPHLIMLATDHGSHWELSGLAVARELAFRTDDAIILQRAAVELSATAESAAYTQGELVALLARTGRCDDATRAMTDLAALSPSPDDWAYAAESLTPCYEVPMGEPPAYSSP